MITVGNASQSGTLCASMSPLNAVVARRTELMVKARSKSMCQFFKLRGVEYPIGLHWACRSLLIRPWHNRHGIASLVVVNEREALAVLGTTSVR